VRQYDVVRSFVLCGRESSLLWTPALNFFDIGPMRQLRERMGIGRRVQCMCALCRVEEKQ